MRVFLGVPMSDETWKNLLAAAAVIIPMLIAWHLRLVDAAATAAALQRQEAKEEAATAAKAAAVEVKAVAEAARATAGEVEHVKEALAQTHQSTDAQLKTIHTLVNSNMGIQLELNMVLAKRLASMPGATEEDKEAAVRATAMFNEHQAKQAVVDGG